MLFAGAIVACGYHLYWMALRMSFIPAQSAAPNSVNTLVLGWIAFGKKRRNTDKRSTITQEDNLAYIGAETISGTLASPKSRMKTVSNGNQGSKELSD